MKLREHLIIGGVAMVILAPHWGIWRALLFWGAEVLIDADHYWDYLWRSKFQDWSGWRMFRYYRLITQKERFHKKNIIHISILHTIEVFIGVFLLAHFWNYTFFITIFLGMVLHIILDMIQLAYLRIFFIRAYSVIEYFIRKRRLLRHGLNPDEFYKKMFELSK